MGTEIAIGMGLGLVAGAVWKVRRPPDPSSRPPPHIAQMMKISGTSPLTSLPSLSFATTELALADTLQVGGVLREHQDEVSVGRTRGREGRPMYTVAPKLVDL